MRSLLFCFLASASLQAASFVTVTCVSPLGDPIIYSDTANSSGCYADSQVAPNQPPRGSAAASGSVTLQMATDPAQFNTLLTNQQASASTVSNPGSATGLGPGGVAQVAINYATDIRTEGPVRPGYLQIGVNSGLIDGMARDGGMAYMLDGLSINPDFNQSATTTAQFCYSASTPNCTPGPTYFGVARPTIPVTLGTVVTVFASGAAQTRFISPIPGSSFGSAVTEFQFRFLEADGVTPVLATETPEPASIALLTLGLLGISASARRKR